MLNYVKGIIVADFITRKTLEIGCLKSGLSIRETLYFHFRNSYIDSATLYTPKTFTNNFFSQMWWEKSHLQPANDGYHKKWGLGIKYRNAKKEKMAQHILFLYTGTI